MNTIITDITTPIEVLNEPIPIGAYCRVSSDSADQLHSFAAQIRYYKDYEKKHPQYKLIDIYADEGLSGTSMKNRDEIHRLIRDCKKGRIKRIIVKSVSRFARNTEELIVTLRMLKSIGVSVYFEEQDIDTEKMNMEMIITFPGMAAQQESETISGNMRWSIKKRMESGEFVGSKTAYGYDLVDGELVINKPEAEVVKEIFNLFLQGHGKQSIANILNEKGIKRRSNKKWHHTTISYILNNERYMGDALLQKKFTTETLPFRKLINHGEVPQYYIENSNVPIICRDVFMKAKELQSFKVSKTKEKQKSEHFLMRILRCPDCGRAFRRQEISGTVYWLCYGKSACISDCKSRRVKEFEVYETFTNMVLKLTDNPKYILEDFIHQIETMQSKTNENQEKIQQIDKEIADFATQNLVITKLHNKGVLNASEYALQTSEIGNKISCLRSQRKKIISENADDYQLDELKTLNKTIKEHIPTLEFDKVLFEQIIESITVESNEELTFKLIGGIELTEAIKEKGRCKTA